MAVLPWESPGVFLAADPTGLARSSWKRLQSTLVAARPALALFGEGPHAGDHARGLGLPSGRSGRTRQMASLQEQVRRCRVYLGRCGRWIHVEAVTNRPVSVRFAG